MNYTEIFFETTVLLEEVCLIYYRLVFIIVTQTKILHYIVDVRELKSITYCTHLSVIITTTTTTIT